MKCFACLGICPHPPLAMLLAPASPQERMRGHVSDSQTGSRFSPSFPRSPCIHQSPAGMSLGLGFPTNEVLISSSPLSPEYGEDVGSKSGGSCISAVLLWGEGNTEMSLRDSTPPPSHLGAVWKRGFRSNPLPFRAPA